MGIARRLALKDRAKAHKLAGQREAIPIRAGADAMGLVLAASGWIGMPIRFP
jgi:hypothetical protein